MILFYANTTRVNPIEMINVASETDKFVFLNNGRREAKICSSSGYFKSFEEARKWLIDDAERKICQLENNINKIRKQIDNYISLQEPK